VKERERCKTLIKRRPWPSRAVVPCKKKSINLEGKLYHIKGKCVTKLAIVCLKAVFQARLERQENRR
jgi:hypothetical protein